jgi:hypothetical protein
MKEAEDQEIQTDQELQNLEQLQANGNKQGDEVKEPQKKETEAC